MKGTLTLESTLSLGNVEVFIFKHEGKRDNRVQNPLVFVTIGRVIYISV